MKLKLPTDITSSQDLSTLIIEIQDYARWFAHESIKKQLNSNHRSEPPVLSPSANELLKNIETKGPHSKKNIDELIESMNIYIKKAPSMTITLAAPPNNNTKSMLVAWCRENIAPNVLINFHFNQILLGGMVVRCGSRIFDWSFRRQILASRDKIPEVLRRV